MGRQRILKLSNTTNQLSSLTPVCNYPNAAEANDREAKYTVVPLATAIVYNAACHTGYTLYLGSMCSRFRDGSRVWSWLVREVVMYSAVVEGHSDSAQNGLIAGNQDSI
jgi:ABC-type polysaccharide/polyol phosphate export permease